MSFKFLFGRKLQLAIFTYGLLDAATAVLVVYKLLFSFESIVAQTFEGEEAWVLSTVVLLMACQSFNSLEFLATLAAFKCFIGVV